jgi:hypothetical protein
MVPPATTLPLYGQRRVFLLEHILEVVVMTGGGPKMTIRCGRNLGDVGLSAVQICEKNQELSHTLMQIFLFLNDLFSEFLKFCFIFNKMRLLSFAENR